MFRLLKTAKHSHIGTSRRLSVGEADDDEEARRNESVSDGFDGQFSSRDVGKSEVQPVGLGWRLNLMKTPLKLDVVRSSGTVQEVDVVL